jgi:hypothetical protein
MKQRGNLKAMISDERPKIKNKKGRHGGFNNVAGRTAVMEVKRGPNILTRIWKIAKIFKGPTGCGRNTDLPVGLVAIVLNLAYCELISAFVCVEEKKTYTRGAGPNLVQSHPIIHRPFRGSGCDAEFAIRSCSYKPEPCLIPEYFRLFCCGLNKRHIQHQMLKDLTSVRTSLGLPRNNDTFTLVSVDAIRISLLGPSCPLLALGRM